MKLKLLYVPRRYTDNRHEYTEKHTFTPPLGIAVLTAVLRKNGFSVDQDDLDVKVFFENWDARPVEKYPLKGFDDVGRITRFLDTANDPELEQIAERILHKTRLRGYDVVGLSTCGQHNISSVGAAVVMVKLLKERYGCSTVLGGLDSMESLLPFDSLVRFPYLDFIVSGHAETSLLNLCHAIEHGQLGMYSMDRVHWRGKVESHKDPPYKDSLYARGGGEFVVPEFDGLPLDLYRYHPLREFERENVTPILSRKRILMLPYYFMIGCPFNCAFCGESFTTNYSIKPVNAIIEDLSRLKRRYRTRHFFFLNDMVNPSLDFARELTSAMIAEDLDILWSDCVHFQCLDRELILDLKKAGAVRLIYGLETASERLLRYANKTFSLAQAKLLLREAHRAGIWNEVELVCGLPTERRGDIDATVRFLIEQKEYINYIHPNRFQLKHSLFLKMPERFGLTGISRIQHEYYTHSFNEVGGLVWQEKMRQIEHSFEAINSTIQERVLGPKGMRFYRPNHNLPFLFYLYELFGDKREVEGVIHDRIHRRSDSPRQRSLRAEWRPVVPEEESGG